MNLPLATPRPAIQRVLMLGHSGFIGQHLERAVRRMHPGLEFVGRSTPALDLTQWESAQSLADWLDPRTVVVMLAAVKRQLGDTLDTFVQNVQMAVNLGRLLQQRPVARLVYFSSAAVYGEEHENTCITEATPVRPTSFYGAAKHAAECLFKKVVGAYPGSSLLIVRPALVYGPGDTGNGYGPSGFSRAARQREPITLWGDGTERREFLFVEDVVDIVGRLIVSESAGVLNVASGCSYTYQDILGILARTAGGIIPPRSRPRSKPKVDHGFQNAALLKALPECTFTELEAGIRQTLAAQGDAR